jgi:hypothetical protein
MPPKIRIGKRAKLSLDNAQSKLKKSLDNTESKIKKPIRTSKTDNTLEAISGAIRTGVRKGQNTAKAIERKADKTQTVIGRKYVKSAAMIHDNKQADKGADAYDMLKKIVNDPKITL